jgi:hypothetical protein
MDIEKIDDPDKEYQVVYSTTTTADWISKETIARFYMREGIIPPESVIRDIAQPG